MNPISPVLPSHPDLRETVIAKNQPPYKPLVGVFVEGPEGRLITRWQLSIRERIKVLFSGCLYVQTLTFNKPVTPISIEVDEP